MIIAILIIWVTVLIAIPTMKKIEPNNKWYQPYAIFVGLLFTAYILIQYLQS